MILLLEGENGLKTGEQCRRVFGCSRSSKYEKFGALKRGNELEWSGIVIKRKIKVITNSGLEP